MCTISHEELFARSYALLGNDNMHLLKTRTAIVYGLGGVGGHCAEALVRMGIKKLYIVDKDSVSASNINRQIITCYTNIAKSKVMVAKERFESISPFTEIIGIEAFYTKDNPICIPNDVDIVLDCIDTISAKLDIIKQCATKNFALICSMGMGNRLDPSKVCFSKLDKTSYDPLSRVMRKLARDNSLQNISVVYSTECAKDINLSNNSAKATPASITFVPSVAGILMAYHATMAMLNNIQDLIPIFKR